MKGSCHANKADKLDRADKNRSARMERAARTYLVQIARQARDRKDLAIIDRNAERLNRYALDKQEYQPVWPGDSEADRRDI